MQSMRKRHEQFGREMRREAPRISAKARAKFDWLREPPPHGQPEGEAEERAETLRERHRDFAARMRREASDPHMLPEEIVCSTLISEADDDEFLTGEEMEEALESLIGELFETPSEEAKKKPRRKRR